jgi:hypothetical protein
MRLNEIADGGSLSGRLLGEKAAARCLHRTVRERLARHGVLDPDERSTAVARENTFLKADRSASRPELAAAANHLGACIFVKASMVDNLHAKIETGLRLKSINTESGSGLDLQALRAFEVRKLDHIDLARRRGQVPSGG